MMTQVSTAPAATGMYQRRGARSSKRKTQQQRELGAQVVGLGEQQVGGVAELGREHDPGRDQQADQPVPPGRPSPGQQAGRQHQQRVGHGARDVDHIGAQAPDQLDEHVLGNFGRVVRHVRDGPAVQQPVPVQHVPRLQRLVRAVRGNGIGPGHPQVGDEQDDGGYRERGEPCPTRPGGCRLVLPPCAAGSWTLTAMSCGGLSLGASADPLAPDDVSRRRPALEPSQGRYLQPGQQVVVVHHDGVFLEVVRAGRRTKLGTHLVRRDKGGIRRRRGYRYDEVRPRHGRVIPRRIGLVRIGGGTPGLQRREPDPAAAIERGDVRFPVRCQACRQMVSFQPVREIHVQRRPDRLGVVVGERSEVAGEPNGEQWR